jgi:hypothetical protein
MIKTNIRLHVLYPLFLSDFSESWIWSCYMLYPIYHVSHHPWVHHSNDNWRTIQITALLTIHFSLALCCVLCFLLFSTLCCMKEKTEVITINTTNYRYNTITSSYVWYSLTLTMPSTNLLLVSAWQMRRLARFVTPDSEEITPEVSGLPEDMVTALKLLLGNQH